tara:strand:+ start:2022 stop:2225 length:204 start_codon:yes stop_codon:yes gene_type:complete
MQIKNPSKLEISQNKITQSELSNLRKVDINILLNKVKIEEKNEIKKKFLIAFGVAGSLLITGLIAVI